jgi:hypothetical protein
MALEYLFEKRKLPKGWSYPLGRSVLDRELERAGVSDLLAVDYTRLQSGHWIVWAHYCGEGNKGWAGAGKVHVYVYAVPSVERKAAEEAILARVLPALASWLTALERAGNTRRGVDQTFDASFHDGALSIHAT